MFITEDGGESWDSSWPDLVSGVTPTGMDSWEDYGMPLEDLPVSYTTNAIEFFDENTGVLAASYLVELEEEPYEDIFSKILKTTDGGATWTEVGETDIHFHATFSNLGEGNIIANYNTELQLSEDWGETWEIIHEDESISFTRLVLRAPGELYGTMSIETDVAAEGAIWFSDNNGVSWTPVYETITEELTSFGDIAFGADGTILASGTYAVFMEPIEQFLFISNNDGDSWSEAFEPTSTVLNLEYANGKMYMDISWDGMYESENGTDWTPSYSGEDGVIKLKQLDDAIYFCGTNGGVHVNRSSGSLSTIDYSVIELTVFPNPASERITISGNEIDFSTLKIINAAGQEVTHLVNANGIQNNLELDISNLSKGLYFIQGQTFKAEFLKK